MGRGKPQKESSLPEASSGVRRDQEPGSKASSTITGRVSLDKSPSLCQPLGTACFSPEGEPCLHYLSKFLEALTFPTQMW